MEELARSTSDGAESDDLWDMEVSIPRDAEVAEDNDEDWEDEDEDEEDEEVDENYPYAPDE